MKRQDLSAVGLAFGAAVGATLLLGGLGLGPDEALPYLATRLLAYVGLIVLLRATVPVTGRPAARAAFLVGATGAGIVLLRSDAAEVGAFGAAIEGIVVFGGLAAVAVVTVAASHRAMTKLTAE